MKLQSFKKDPSAADIPPRTPSPISHLVEPLSPTYPTALHDAPLFPNRNAEAPPARATSGRNTIHNGTGEDTEPEPERNGRAGRSSRRSRHYPNSGVHIPAHGSPIDALADIASSLAPSPLFAPAVHYPSQVQSSSPSMPYPVGNGQRHARLASDSQNYRYSHAYSNVYDHADRPSKRARSEATHAHPYNQGSSRPSTSHIPSVQRHNVQGERSVSSGGWTAQERQSHDSMQVDHDQMDIAQVLLGLRNGSIDGAHTPKTFPGSSHHPTGGYVQSSWHVMPSAQAHFGLDQSKQDHRLGEGRHQYSQADKSATNDHQTRGSIASLEGVQAAKQSSSAIQTHTPPEETLDSLTTEGPSEDMGHVDQKKTKTHQGWPKGKARGPRNKTVNSRRTSKAAPAANGLLVPNHPTDGQDGPDQLQSPQSLSEGPAEDPSLKDKASEASSQNRAGVGFTHLQIEPNPKTRRSSLSDMTSRDLDDSKSRTQPGRCSSVPLDNTMLTVEPDTVLFGAKEKQPPASAKAEEVTICAGCGFSRGPSTGQKDQWICCNGCQNWYHFACAGFKSVKEVSSVDKFHCKPCKPQHGPTTFLRKSKRAHTSVDYAGLNEGVLRTTEDEHEHHYIQAIKDGTFAFQPETFPRMRPELVTAENFERSGGFKEPVVIPACWNPRPGQIGSEEGCSKPPTMETEGVHKDDQDDMDLDFESVPDDGQDTLDMVIPDGLTVRRVSELYGPDERVEVIDVKSQEGEDKRWTMNKWVDYYEDEGDKPVRNVISLEVSQSTLGRLIRRPKVVRDLDLQDAVWPQDEIAKGIFPKVQFYCLMSVADCYTDFHIDFGGSSVYYHIIKGKKTFFFIPPKKQHLKKYEDWCLSQAQNWTFLADETKECYRVDLSEGDTMLIPSGWIHAVWTPENSLVIGGNFLTRLNYGMQIRIAEIEKNTKVARKFRYPYFQRVLWLAVLEYLKTDPLPNAVAQMLCSGTQFRRTVPTYCELNKFGHNSDPGQENYNARYYSKSELEGMPDLVSYIFRTVMISQGRVEGVTNESRNAVTRSIPKGHGDPIDIVRTFAMWVAWKRGNEDIPQWAHPEGDLPELGGLGGDKKLSSAALKRLERKAYIDAYRHAPERQSTRQRTKTLDADIPEGEPSATALSPQDPNQTKQQQLQHMSTPKTSVLGPKRIACDACRKRRIRCKHKDDITSPKAGGPINGDMRRPSDAGLVTVVIPSPRKAVNGLPIIGAPVNGTHQPKLEPSLAVMGSSISLDPQYETPDSKRGRSKACLDCRKSKRRCIHDEYGNIDPVKAQETPVPRGLKRRASEGESQGSDKKAKKDSKTALNLVGGMPLSDHDIIPNGHVATHADALGHPPMRLSSEISVPEADDVDAALDPLLRGSGPPTFPQKSEVDQIMEDAPDFSAPEPAGDATDLAVHEPVRQTHEAIHHSDVAIPSTEMDIDPFLDPALADCVPLAQEPVQAQVPPTGQPSTNGVPTTPAPPPVAELSSPLSDLAPSPQQQQQKTNGTLPPAHPPHTPTAQRQSSRASKPVDRYSASAHEPQSQQPQRHSQTPKAPPATAQRTPPSRSQRAQSQSARRASVASNASAFRRDSKTPSAKMEAGAGKPRSMSQMGLAGEDEASIRLIRELMGQDRGLRRRGS